MIHGNFGASHHRAPEAAGKKSLGIAPADTDRTRGDAPRDHAAEIAETPIPTFAFRLGGGGSAARIRIQHLRRDLLGNIRPCDDLDKPGFSAACPTRQQCQTHPAWLRSRYDIMSSDHAPC